MKFTAVRLNADTDPVEPDEVHAMAQAGAELRSIEGHRAQEILAAAQD